MAAMALNTLIKSYDESDYCLVRKLSQLGSLGSTYFKVRNPDTNITCTSIYMGAGVDLYIPSAYTGSSGSSCLSIPFLSAYLLDYL
jgi:hypothetical protein